ncbi:UbiX family flavin prenyltransferase [Bradyrhizobium frederickii]|uniref:UbiX family flavin prenyltransferase n=1 Tax=Bradyrhizobium frederickii TaxID=2560054 RepID=UPI001430A551|nr:UbiX family flavin prenyltransferase [Bradyrhizobium frederickii]
MSKRQGLIVGISGASGAAIGMRIVELLADNPHYAVHLVVSPAAERTLSEEVGSDALARLRAIAFRHHPHSDVGAAIASGSYPVAGMIVAPCSIRTLSAIAWGQLDNLLTRAADVQLKERRPLVLLVRESPLHLGHLRSMLQATEIGAIIAPPMMRRSGWPFGFSRRIRSARFLLCAMAAPSLTRSSPDLSRTGTPSFMSK